MMAHSGTNQYSPHCCKAVGWRLTDLDPSRLFPLCVKPRTVRVGPVPVAQVTGKRPSADISSLVDIRPGFRSLGFVFGSMLFFVPFADPFLSLLCFFPYFLIHGVPNVCLLSHTIFFCPVCVFFCPLDFCKCSPVFFVPADVVSF